MKRYRHRPLIKVTWATYWYKPRSRLVEQCTAVWDNKGSQYNEGTSKQQGTVTLNGAVSGKNIQGGGVYTLIHRTANLVNC